MDLNDPALYTNRDLSWLAFNGRVLEEALDTGNPLMERLKFLSITASNLDEFFMVRVSSLWDQDSAGAGPDLSGMTPKEQRYAISSVAHEMVEMQYECFNHSLRPAMEKAHIRFPRYGDLREEQRGYAEAYFNDTLYPVLTPMAIDQSRPFPVLNNRTVNLFIELENESGDTPLYAVVQVPTVLPRILQLPGIGVYVLLEDIMLAHIGRLFPGLTVLRASLLRVTRNSDLVIDEDDIDDLLFKMERSIQRRRWGDPVRIEVTRGMGPNGLVFLKTALDLEEGDIYVIDGPLDLTIWMGFAGAPHFARLRNKPLPPAPAAAFVGCESLFDVIRERDVLIHHPYTGFDCVVRFVREAAADPNVLAIKQTLYRVSGQQSPIVDALIQAAENGKQVTVLVELKARFDE